MLGVGGCQSLSVPFLIILPNGTFISCLLQTTSQGDREHQHEHRMLGHLRHGKKKSRPGGQNQGSTSSSAL